MSDGFLDMLVFVRVTEAGSLSRAARELGFSLTVVSRKLSRLEERLGVRLINRTTRSLTLTEEGSRFYDRSVRILAEIEDAETEAASGKDSAIGTLKVTATFAFGVRWLAPLLAEFQQSHPMLNVRLDTTDGLINIVEDGYDLAIRFGDLADSSLIARQLAPNRRVICAAPAYLDRSGRPSSIEDLVNYDVVSFGDPANTHWTFEDGRSVNVRSRLGSNNGELAHRWALQGRGLILKSIWDVEDDVASGKLEIVLPDQRLPAAPIHAVFPHNRLAAAKVRLCVDFLAARLKRAAPRAV
ncbi:LysR family transcriptional regulator [Rhizobium wenxiniae]|uniref:HTH-type transcriptional regulator TtuA n=1 Tax=Rhizobium wenxiniae TaxID=1737357 RepID=A0A7W9Y7V9_9HYPH|nr:LysR family transcriptional regulator [Rhizobium wenxiniae]MBB6163609.1 DNA-binding transcriptional LysR family regulator [Rhizobium wenxiniae]GGG11646.1 LysR family transcriptional regulator [Rhizobium wenxiniae]